jgi:hypothetical protein
MPQASDHALTVESFYPLRATCTCGWALALQSHDHEPAGLVRRRAEDHHKSHVRHATRPPARKPAEKVKSR